MQNPNATIPTLTHGGKSFTSTTEVVNYLASISSTKVAPETTITTVVHEDRIDPNTVLFSAVRPRVSSSTGFLIGRVSEERQGTRQSLRRLRKRFHHHP